MQAPPRPVLAGRPAASPSPSPPSLPAIAVRDRSCTSASTFCSGHGVAPGAVPRATPAATFVHPVVPAGGPGSRGARRSRGRSRQPGGRVRWAIAGLALAAGSLGTACEPYRVEYHRRPAFFQEMSDEKLPDQVTLPDGTVVVYSPHRGERRDPVKEKVESEGFTLRAERPDGTVELRAMMPEHVLAHCLTCIRNGEYRLLWDQLVAEQTKLAYAEQGLGYEAFEAFMLEHRVELARMLTRMSLGINMHECAQGYVRPGLYRVQFHPRVVMNNDGTRQFRFSKVDMAPEGFQLRLVLIH